MSRAVTPIVAEVRDSIERCTTCALPRSLPFVDFTEDGMCEFCRLAKRRAKIGEADESDEGLEEVIERIRDRGRGRQFDCLVGLSGGRDSCYLLYLLTQKHNLRCAAAYHRTPFVHDVIDENVRKIVKQLGTPLIEMNVPWRVHQEVARYYCILWKRHPVPEVANLACVPCKLHYKHLFRISRAYNIRTLVFGRNKYEEVQITPTFQAGDLTRGSWSFWNQARKVSRIIKKGMLLLYKCPAVTRHLPLAFEASVLYLSPHTVFQRLHYPDIHTIEYFFSAPWVESECVETIRSKLGWQMPPGCTQTWRVDCDFAAVKDYIFYKMYNATYTDFMLSNLIRAGQITREEALSRLEGKPYFSLERARRALDIMNLPLDFVEEPRGADERAV